MARQKSPLLRKLEKALTQRFPLPATIKLTDQDGFIGVVTSAGFAEMDSMDRQHLIGDIVATHLSQKERRRVRIIVGVTPDEATGYLASVE